MELDPHYAYLGTNIFTRQEVVERLDFVIREGKRMGLFTDVDYELNYVTRHTGEHTGVSYIKCNNPHFIHVLVGNNPDGSERKITKENLDWKPLICTYKTLDEYLNSFKGKDWWEMAEEELAYEKDKYIVDVLPPLVEMPKLKLDKDKRERLIKYLTGRQKYEDIQTLTDSYFIKPKYLEYKSPPEGYSGHVLVGKRIPKWLTEAMVKKHFQRFISEDHHGVIDKQYPIVKFLPTKGISIVTFRPGSYDAYYAMTMGKYIKQNGNPKAAVPFDYSENRS
ncbi:Hypothetical protein ORPV_35 [Orpheovirus IHUMI-LCC2]|uniref:Uncharacterized protein n=1 Tax=Orpheovirus IHUMI-LCC2 TaxID=2023057 RepID=A0A2I2L387_9VIRU|nr:Hypothetical protein ORPV_35 [Orpheovirus IHUMI-LCC2]SNW61939.1 Hypothetical protein ORPV_35 [Orpheovirus IHUMI-LCC2]